MKKASLILSCVALSAVLSACGGAPSGGGTTPPGPTPPPPPPNNGSTLTRAQIAGCPVLSGSSDPAAPNCLKGKLVGKALDGSECTLTIGEGGAYQYVAKALNSTFVPNADDVRVFGHQKIGGGDQVVWIISSKLSANDDENKELRFDYASPLGYTVNIEVKVGRTVSACTAQI